MTTITSNVDALGTASVSNKKSDTLGQQDFLRLLTTQLKTQDPFDPVDNTQMVAQMAQFSATTGIAEMNASLKAIAGDLAGSRIGGAASWIGRAALVPSDIAIPDADGGFAGEVAIDKPATNVSLSFVDAKGTVVHTETLGPQRAGSIGFRWDGKDAGGAAVTGPVKLVVNTTASSGSVKATTSAWVPVTSIQSPASGAEARLVTPIGTFDPADAQRLG